VRFAGFLWSADEHATPILVPCPDPVALSSSPDVAPSPLLRVCTRPSELSRFSFRFFGRRLLPLGAFFHLPFHGSFATRTARGSQRDYDGGFSQGRTKARRENWFLCFYPRGDSLPVRPQREHYNPHFLFDPGVGVFPSLSLRTDSAAGGTTRSGGVSCSSAPHSPGAFAVSFTLDGRQIVSPWGTRHVQFPFLLLDAHWWTSGGHFWLSGFTSRTSFVWVSPPAGYLLLPLPHQRHDFTVLAQAICSPTPPYTAIDPAGSFLMTADPEVLTSATNVAFFSTLRWRRPLAESQERPVLLE